MTNNEHLTIANTPRDLEALKRKSSYRLHVLLVELSEVRNPETGQLFMFRRDDESETAKMTWGAFFRANADVRASFVLAMLQTYDRAMSPAAPISAGPPITEAPAPKPEEVSAESRTQSTKKTFPEMLLETLFLDVLKARWVVSTEQKNPGEFGLRIAGVNLWYYKYGTPMLAGYTWRYAEKQELGDTVGSLRKR